jgi:plasmid stabilization system protein ParE
MKVRYTETALAEIEDILTYIAKDNRLAAGQVEAVVRATVARLSGYLPGWQSRRMCPMSALRPCFPIVI